MTWFDDWPPAECREEPAEPAEAGVGVMALIAARVASEECKPGEYGVVEAGPALA